VGHREHPPSALLDTNDASREFFMPAKSEAQRRKLNAKFGHAWVKAHGFDNKGKLPMHAKKKPKTKARKTRAKKKSTRRAKPRSYGY
jgi:hypothetical protein